jgi:adenosylhomocysteine nucleosidase
MKTKTSGIVMATKIEAEPFIEGFGLALVEKKPVRLYAAGPLVLALSGIGKAAAAIATAALIERHHPDAVFNCGAAGAAAGGFAVGDILQIDKVYEPDRLHLLTGRPMKHKPDTMRGFRRASLATRDRPFLGVEDRHAAAAHADLVDMEGAAVVQACRAYGVDVYLFKIVTDTHGAGAKEIIGTMIATRGSMFEFFRDRIRPGL